MGLGGVEGPPKKKLKQAQLNFSVTSERTNNKRKLSDASDGLAPKLFRKDSGAAKTPLFNKENVVTSNVNEVQKKAEPANDVVVVIDDSSIDSDKPVSEGTVNKAADETSRKGVEVGKDDGGQESKEDVKSKLDESTCTPVPVNEAPSRAEDSEKPVIESNIVKSSDADEEDRNVMDVSTVSEVPSDIDAGKECSDSKGRSDSKHDKSVESDQADLNTSEDDLAAGSPNQKTTPKMKTTATTSSSSKKAERERLREEKRRLRKEKQELKQKEKEDKEKKRQEDLRLKEEEKRLKEEAKKRKEEEKRKKEELKEEAHRKKKEERLAEERKEKEKEERKKAAFTKFFILEKTPKPSLPKEEETEANTDKSERPKFMPFPVKSDMRLAVQVRHTLTEEEKNNLSRVLGLGQPVEKTYLRELKNRKPMTSSATWPLSEEQHDVIIVESVEDDKSSEEPRPASIAKAKDQNAKLLQFHENRRPPYWGTWRKSSTTVGPRKPFGHDEILDYEVDSDSEWEDEEEGEDIDKEDGDSDKEEADDENVGENGYVLDNTFVPHGYLSDEEAAEAEDDDSIEDQKLKLTVLKQEFDQELKSKTQRLQPRLLGCVYISNKTLEVSKSLYEPLMKLRCKWDSNEEPIDVQSPPVVECNPSPSVSNAKFPSSLVERLAKLIHGNRSSLKALISQFLDDCDKDTQLSAVSKRAVFLKVKEIAAKTYSSESGRLVWTVNPDLCGEFGLEPIIDQSRAVAPVSPVVEPLKPKDSPLANFLKKPTPQGPIKRIPTTLIPRVGPSETTPVHVDTPRPKVTPQSAPLAGHKPIRRVTTTLLSSVPGPVKNKTFNVGEIEKPGQTVPRATVTHVVDLTDSMDGITPLSNSVDDVPPAASNLNTLPQMVNAPSGSASMLSTSVKDDHQTPADHSHNLSSKVGENADQTTAISSTSPVKDATAIDNSIALSNGSSAGDMNVSVSNVKEQVSATADSTVALQAVKDSFSQSVPVASPPALVKDSPLPSDASLPMKMDKSTVSTADLVVPSTVSLPLGTDKSTVSSADSAVPSTAALPMETDKSAVSTADSAVPSTAALPMVTDKSAVSTADPAVPSAASLPMEIDKLTVSSADPAVPSTAALPKGTDKLTVSTADSAVPFAASLPMEIDKSTVSSADSAIPSAAPGDTIPSPMDTDVPPELPTAQVSSNDANPSTQSKDATPAAPKPSPATPTIRKRVPLTTLSKSVSKPKTPVQKVSIPEMFCRKQAKKDNSDKPAPL